MKQILRSILPLFILLITNLSLKAQVDGLMFSMTYGGGNIGNPIGVINQFDPLTNFDTAVVNFNGINGKEGYGNFIQLNNGLLYGMTPDGGSGYGDIIQYNIQTGKESVLFNFPNTNNLDSGAYPYGTLCHATNDLLYGLAYYYGGAGRGELFSFNYHTGAFDTLVALSSATTGGLPTGNLIQVNDSLLYGLTTYYSGEFGTIIQYNINTGLATALHIFTGAPGDGNYPRGSLLLATNGLLYGLTIYGGTSNSGTLFSFNPTTNVEMVLVNFTGPNGANPEESLMQASNGNLYGTTSSGGAHDSGTLFRYNIGTGVETVLHSFGGSNLNGYYPYSDLIQASDGLLYGNTNGNSPFGTGKNNWGTIFSYDIGTNAFTTRYYFNDTNGDYPYGDMLEVMSTNVSVTNNHCPNDSSGILTINVRGGKPPFTYLWSNGKTTGSLTNLKSGAYCDTVWDSRGIKFVSYDTVKPLPMVLTFNVSNPCHDTNNGSVSANVSGGTSPFTYAWSNSETTDTISNIASGTYTCIATDHNGCSVKNTVTATRANPITITGIVATEQTFPFTNGKVTVSVSGGIPPGDSVCYYYLWSNGGPDSATITQLGSGTYSVCVTSCYSGCGSACSDSVQVLTGIHDINNTAGPVKVYPVPSSGLITINLIGNNFENITITDALGRSVYKESLSSQIPNNTLHLDLSNQPNGVYILYVNSQQGVLTRKIIIQK